MHHRTLYSLGFNSHGIPIANGFTELRALLLMFQKRGPFVTPLAKSHSGAVVAVRGYWYKGVTPIGVSSDVLH
jgi:hypothetical protein